MGNMQRGQFGKAIQSTDPLAECPVGTTIDYSPGAIEDLLFMIEEEKLAGDLYEQFFDQTGLAVFDRIAAAEDKHQDALLTQALLAGIDVDGLISLPAGQFANPELQTLYDQLLLAGGTSPSDALAVGQLVEQTDMADLAAVMVEVVGTPLAMVYSHLQTSSEHHLAAFDAWLSI